jgi:CheY-like chemotaxis protein
MEENRPCVFKNPGCETRPADKKRLFMEDGPGTSTRNILIIEDDALTSLALLKTIEAADRTILTATKGPQALAEIRSRRYDLIFLEIGLFDQPGISLLKEISISNLSTCVVVMSAATPDGEIENMVIDYDHFFLPKPFDGLQVKTLVTRILTEKGKGEGAFPRPGKRVEERRRWLRSKLFDRLICQPAKDGTCHLIPGPFSAEITDVSPGGLGIRTDNPVPPGQRIFFQGESFVEDGVVRWSLVLGNRFRAGVQLTSWNHTK